MKKIKALFIVLAAASVLTSCEDYFTVDLKDQANMDEVFSESTTTKRYLSHLYSYLPLDEEVVGSDGWVVARSDEAMFSWYQWVYYLGYRTGNYGSATGSKSDSGTSFNYWKKFYVAIRQCTTFMDYVDKDVKDSEEIRAAMKAEARFLRAFYYFCLFRQYGPVIVWGDQLAPEDVDGASLDRNTVDENINFIVTELDKAIADLPMNIEDIGESVQKWQGRATKGAAMALKSRVLLFAASPLYNGCELYKGQMKNKDGNYLFPQQADPEKWEAAAQAALDVINLNKYNLCKVVKTGDAFKDGAASYQSVFFEPWNEETIFGWWRRTSDSYSWLYGGAPLACACPPNMEGIYQGYGGIAPSLRLVDTYPMWESGRYPVKGYQKDGVYNNYSRPIIDEESGYVNTGWEEGYKQPIDADWAPAFKAHKSTVGRDPRYYASVLPNGFYWPDKALGKRFTCYDNAECTSRWSEAQAVRVGYCWRKLYEANQPLKVGTDYTAIKEVHPEFRMAEIWLNYAEACNEKPNRDEAAALNAINQVRNRVGLNNIEEAYPEITGNKELLRWCIQKERMVEFGMEAMRHYDACRWMVAKDEYPAENWTLHCKSENYEDSYNRVCDEIISPAATFTDRDYLFPINADQLSEMINITQNYGF